MLGSDLAFFVSIPNRYNDENCAAVIAIIELMSISSLYAKHGARIFKKNTW